MNDKNKDKISAEEMLAKYLESDYPADVKRALQGWLASEHNREEKEAALKKVFDYTVRYNSRPSRMAVKMLGEWNFRMGRAHVDVMKLIRPYTPFYRTTPFRVAAVLIPLLVVAGWLLFYNPQAVVPVQMAMVTMAVPDTLGAQGRIDLTDGSDVFIRPGSSVSYAEDFQAGEKRRVILAEGGVYLNVAKDSVRRFVVETPHLNVNVYGTKFNVETMPEQGQTIVTLYQGKVKVDGITARNGLSVIEMSPGQQLVYNHGTGEYRIEQTAALLPGWIAERLVFENAKYADIFRTIEWYYGVKIEVEGELKRDSGMNFRFTGREDIETAMWLFQNVSREFDYEHNDKIVRVKAHQ